MKRTTSFLVFIFSIIFLLQSSAWATVASSTYSHQIQSALVKKYNELSEMEKQKLVSRAIEQRPINDQVFWKHNFDVKKNIFPELRFEKGKLVFTHNKKEMSFLLKSRYQFEVNEKMLDFSPGRLSQATYELEKILNEMNFSYLNLFMNSAHAFVGAGVAYFIAIIIIIPTLGMIDKSLKEEEWNEELSSLCEGLKSQYELISPLAGYEGKQKLASAVSEGLKKLEKDAYCGVKGSYLSIEWERPKCEAHAKARACLEELDFELKNLLGSVNQGERGEVKDIARPKSAGHSEITGSSAQ